jgi:hypothetical protein
MKKGNLKKTLTILFFIFFFGAFLGTLVHEFIGHGLTTLIFGGKITHICVLFLELNQESIFFNPCINHSGYFGYLGWQFEEIDALSYGFITIMGPISTFFISIISSFVILFKKSSLEILDTSYQFFLYIF